MAGGLTPSHTMSKFMIKIIAFIIFLIPLSAIIKLGETDLWYSHYFFSSFFLFLFLAYNLRKFNLPLSIFLAWVVFSSYFVASHHPRSFLTLVQLMGFSYMACLISTFNSKGRGLIVRSLLAVFVLQSFMMILQFFNVDPIFNSIKDITKDSIVGLSASPNQFGLFMADMGAVVLLFSPHLFLVSVAGAALSKTSFALVGMSIGTLLFLLISKSRLFIRFVIMFLVVISIFLLTVDRPSLTNAKERWRVWYNSIKSVETGRIEMTQKRYNGISTTRYVTCNRWTGFGFGNFMRISPYSQSAYLIENDGTRWFDHVYEHAHNDYVEIYFDTGRVGFALLSILLWNFLCLYSKAKEKTLKLKSYFCAIVTHLIAALGIYTVHTVVSGMMLAVLYGLYIGELRDGQTSSLG